MQNEKRRPRGPSPKGDFEQSKTVANAMIEEKREADRIKTQALRAARLSAVEPTRNRHPQ
jgi:hypothetical protein